MSSNQRKSNFLGMPFGTACNRLKKNIMFSLVCKLGMDTCYRCGHKIESVDDLSIEHMQEWEGIDKELFWDIDNIAFSHLKCNVPIARKGAKRMVGQPGTAWCVKCKAFKLEKEFRKDASRWNGLDKRCASCHESYRKEWRK
jgi:hypothetical protein